MSVVGLTVITILFVTGLGQVHARCTKTDPLQKQFKNENRLCDLCPPGYYMLKACTRTWGTSCVRCPDDHYMPYNNSCPSCLLCTYPCRHNTFFVEVQPCTSTQNRVCKCSAGLYLLGDTCTPVTCPPGQKVALKEFPVCRPCPTMTFSSGNNNLTFCTPKTDCKALGLQVKWKGNKTHDAVCQDESKQVPTSPGVNTSVAGKSQKMQNVTDVVTSNAVLHSDSNIESTSMLHSMETETTSMEADTNVITESVGEKSTSDSTSQRSMHSLSQSMSTDTSMQPQSSPSSSSSTKGMPVSMQPDTSTNSMLDILTMTSRSETSNIDKAKLTVSRTDSPRPGTLSKSPDVSFGDEIDQTVHETDITSTQSVSENNRIGLSIDNPFKIGGLPFGASVVIVVIITISLSVCLTLGIVYLVTRSYIKKRKPKDNGELQGKVLYQRCDSKESVHIVPDNFDNFVLKEGIDPEDVFSTISEKINRALWRGFVRAKPCKLKPIDVEDIEFNPRNSQRECIYQCLVLWKSRLPDGEFPLADLLRSLAAIQGTLVNDIINESCDQRRA